MEQTQNKREPSERRRRRAAAQERMTAGRPNHHRTPTNPLPTTGLIDPDTAVALARAALGRSARGCGSAGNGPGLGLAGRP